MAGEETINHWLVCSLPDPPTDLTFADLRLPSLKGFSELTAEDRS